jgi:hypothetical protein
MVPPPTAFCSPPAWPYRVPWRSGWSKAPTSTARLRRYHTPTRSPLTSAWATPLYRVIYDPDGRPRSMRRLGQF